MPNTVNESDIRTGEHDETQIFVHEVGFDGQR
ncbi:hypothetical protein HDEF_1022 [Candidatus Hamiltonella defensa 5AT (Acyrthosiphon pisum)]|uniref:Uncharacterized protein n=1 Tax=Hamiltonella defensa subsp. Acyrthosiphon pisum (strain 5AT) TaxID=572265 RepID=C4K576_HAMD5|nr:hypothetical protein HDEF_1022 [Candidatus Hamiltonella defensa 5AT (Acyrthosiphon pisum)]